MAAAEPITAACSCGDVALQFSRPPVFQAICACRDCQQRTGSAFGMSAYFEADALETRTGAPTVYRRISDKERWLDFRFCPTCGVTVWWEAEFLPGKIGVAASLLSGAAFAPDGAFFCASKPDWVTFGPDIPIAMAATTQK